MTNNLCSTDSDFFFCRVLIGIMKLNLVKLQSSVIMNDNILIISFWSSIKYFTPHKQKSYFECILAVFLKSLG